MVMITEGDGHSGHRVGADGVDHDSEAIGDDSDENDEYGYRHGDCVKGQCRQRQDMSAWQNQHERNQHHVNGQQHHELDLSSRGNARSLRCRQSRHVGRLPKHSGRAGSAHVCQRAGTS